VGTTDEVLIRNHHGIPAIDLTRKHSNENQVSCIMQLPVDRNMTNTELLESCMTSNFRINRCQEKERPRIESKLAVGYGPSFSGNEQKGSGPVH
jgi:hypothetical protein